MTLLDPPGARAALTALVAQLTEDLAQADGAARTVALDDPIGRLSRMDAIQQQQMAAAGRRATALRLRQAEAALGRLDTGDWGACLACGEDIDGRRLAARPEVPFCLGCQQSRDA